MQQTLVHSLPLLPDRIYIPTLIMGGALAGRHQPLSSIFCDNRVYWIFVAKIIDLNAKRKCPRAQAVDDLTPHPQPNTLYTLTQCKVYMIYCAPETKGQR